MADRHDYQECFYASQPGRGRAAQDCDRFPCRVYREGNQHGYSAGYSVGYAAGHAEGYAEGYAEGLASCPGPHGAGWAAMTLVLAVTGHGAHGADPVTVILIGFAAVTGYLLSLYLKPIRTCPRCNGTGAKLASTGRPTGTLCRRCRGTGRIRRLGATAVHRFYWSALGDRQREQRRDRHPRQ